VVLPNRHALGEDAAPPESVALKPHPWRPPFGLDAIGQFKTPGLQAAVEVSGAQRRHPLDAGVIFPQNDTLIAFPGDRLRLRLALCDFADAESHATFTAAFRDGGHATPRMVVEERIAVPVRRRADCAWSLLVPDGMPPRSTLHFALRAPTGATLWQSTVPVVCPPVARKWPDFGAVECQLMYDLPISVRDPATGSYSRIPYKQGWNPALQDVVVCLPDGGRFVFWRGASYVPFWAHASGLGTCYEWAEMLPPRPPDAVDCVEPLMDKELRFGRVEIRESTAARIHVRWRYQSCDLQYRVWGDEAVEDYYFYPDGFGTRVLTLYSSPEANYELAELILLLPPGAYPLQVAPQPRIDVLFLDGTKRDLRFPVRSEDVPGLIAPGPTPAVFCLRARDDDKSVTVLFHPTETRLPPVVFAPFFDGGQLVTPAYWGSHWPLARGNMTGGAIDDRVHVTPHHVSLASWAHQRPVPLREKKEERPDTLGRIRWMSVREWVWMIGNTEDSPEQLVARAQGFAHPPLVTVSEGSPSVVTWVPERRATRIECAAAIRQNGKSGSLAADARKRIDLEVRAQPVVVDPVFEIEWSGDSRRDETNAAPVSASSSEGVALRAVMVDEVSCPQNDYRWDGRVLWLKGVWNRPIKLSLSFEETRLAQPPAQ
jgi:hypothetical protein